MNSTRFIAEHVRDKIKEGIDKDLSYKIPKNQNLFSEGLIIEICGKNPYDSRE